MHTWSYGRAGYKWVYWLKIATSAKELQRKKRDMSNAKTWFKANRMNGDMNMKRREISANRYSHAADGGGFHEQVYVFKDFIGIMQKKKRQNPTHSVDTPDADWVPNFLFASYAEWKYTRLLILSRTMKIYMNTKKKCLFCIRLMRRGDCLRRKNVSTLMVVDHTMFLLPRYMTFKGLNVASRTRLRARITCFALTHTWSTYCQSYSTQLYLSVRVRLRSDAFLWTQTMFTERVYRFRIKRVSKQIEFKMHIYINTNTYNISNYRCNKTLLLALTISYEN